MPSPAWERLAEGMEQQGLLPRRRPQDELELDITPMIDVTFLLLIFFLVASRPDARSAVELARAHHGQGTSLKKSIVLTVSHGTGGLARIYLSDGKLPEHLLPGDEDTQREAIRGHVLAGRSRGLTEVVIKAERTLPHREVRRVAEAASVEGMALHLAVFEVK